MATNKAVMATRDPLLSVELTDVVVLTYPVILEAPK